jgi:hypothetical protein
MCPSQVSESFKFKTDGKRNPISKLTLDGVGLWEYAGLAALPVPILDEASWSTILARLELYQPQSSSGLSAMLPCAYSYFGATVYKFSNFLDDDLSCAGYLRNHGPSVVFYNFRPFYLGVSSIPPMRERRL